MKHARSAELAIRMEAAETAIEVGAFRHWLDRHPDAGAEAPRVGQDDPHGGS